jgi:isochorismate hydrolase
VGAVRNWREAGGINHQQSIKIHQHPPQQRGNNNKTLPTEFQNRAVVPKRGAVVIDDLARYYLLFLSKAAKHETVVMQQSIP